MIMPVNGRGESYCLRQKGILDRERVAETRGRAYLRDRVTGVKVFTRTTLGIMGSGCKHNRAMWEKPWGSQWLLRHLLAGKGSQHRSDDQQQSDERHGNRGITPAVVCLQGSHGPSSACLHGFYLEVSSRLPPAAYGLVLPCAAVLLALEILIAFVIHTEIARVHTTCGAAHRTPS